MKLVCPACNAKYSISAERLEGRTTAARCKRCGGTLVEDRPSDPDQGGQMYVGAGVARRVDERRAAGVDLFAGLASAGAEETVVTSVPGFRPSQTGPTSLTGERNESSVLFSLATLANRAPEPPAQAANEASGLIDIRALSQAMSAPAARSSVDDIMNLGGGGAFAPPLAAPVLALPADPPELAERRSATIVIAAFALALVAIVGVAAFVVVRERAQRDTLAAADRATVSPTDPSAQVASVDPSARATADPSSHVASDPSARAALASSAQVASSSSPWASARTPGVARPATSQATSATTVTAAPKCCPQESDTACRIRLSVGGSCAADTPQTTVATAPFDRVTASRALGAVSLASCKKADGPVGPGHVKVTFQPNGTVSAADVDTPPFSGTAVGGCIAQRYRGVTIPAFTGSPLTVGKGFTLD
jgi:predicted Zn finger-like uncharacterized protein